MAQYRQLGRIVDVIQFDGTNDVAVIEFLGFDTEDIGEEVEILVYPKPVAVNDWFFIENGIVQTISEDDFINYYEEIPSEPV